MSGRPTDLTPELQRKILAAIRVGNYRETAAESVGITRQTLGNWERWGRDGKEAYVDFFVALKKAEGYAERKMLRMIRSRVKDWQAIAWIMERRFPAKFGGRVRATISDERETLLAKVQSDPDLHERLRNVLDEGSAATAQAAAQH